MHRTQAGEAVEDGELVRRLRAGERGAFAALVARHGGPLLRLARLLARDEAAARELVRDTWLAMLDTEGLEDEGALGTWLFRSLADRARTRARRGSAGPALPAAAASSDDEPVVDPDRFDARGGWADPPATWAGESPTELARRADTRGAMEAAIDGLPLAERAVLVLRDLEGLPMDEVGRLLDIAGPAPRALLHRARARVARALEGHARAGGVGAAGSRGPREDSAGPGGVARSA